MEWQDTPFNGQGAFAWPDGSRYEGEWLEGLPSGRGKYVWPDGCCYEGEWLQGLPNGKGEYASSDGTRLKTEWEGGRSQETKATDELTSELKVSVENQRKTIAELQQQLARQLSVATKADTRAAKDAEVRCKALEAEKFSAENRVKTLEQQVEKLAVELESSLVNHQQTLADFKGQLSLQTTAAQEAAAAAASAEDRSHALEAQAETLAAELKNAVKSHQKSLAKLQQQLDLQIGATQKAEAALAEAQDRNQTLEAGKIQAEERVRFLEQQEEINAVQLEAVLDSNQKTIEDLQQKLAVQIDTAQKAEADAAEAQGRCRILATEKTAADDRVKELTEQIETLSAELNNAVKTQQKSITKLQQELSLQRTAFQKAEADTARDAEVHYQALEAEKKSAENKVQALEGQREMLAVELKSTIENDRKTIADLQQQLAVQSEAAKQAASANAVEDGRYETLLAEKLSAEEKVKSIEQQARMLAVELESTIEVDQTTIADLRQQLEVQSEVAKQAAAAAAVEDGRYRMLEAEKLSAEERVKILEQQAEALSAERQSTLSTHQKATAELEKELALQIIAVKQAEALAAADSDARYRALEAEKSRLENSVKALQQQEEKRSAELNGTIEDRQKAIADLQRQLALQIETAQRAEALTVKDAEERYRVLEAQKIAAEEKVTALEQQTETLAVELVAAIENKQKTVSALERQFTLQSAATQEAQTAATNAEARCNTLEDEKNSAEKKLKVLEQRMETGTAKLKTTAKNQKKTITELKKQLAVQLDTGQKAEASTIQDAEDRYNALEAEKISVEEKLKALEQQAEASAAELKNTIENQRKTITELARQLAEADEKNRSLQQRSVPASTEAIPEKEQSSKVYKDGRSYLGELKDDLPDGLGVMTFPDGGQYVGQWSAGTRDGRGTQTNADGSSYAGQWEKDFMAGEGILIIPEERTYMGTWKNDLSDGRGIEIYPDSKRYEGEFKRGKYEGQGTLTLANGTRYAGEFKNSLSNGKGVLKYPNGDRYEGEFKNNQYHGQGTLTLTDGRKYTGELEKGLPHGQGIMVLADGRKYIGEFKNGQFVDKKISRGG